MSFWQRFVYPILPVPLQHMAISAYGWQWMRRRYGGIFNKEYKNVKDRESFTYEQWNSYQTMELRKMLLHAFDTVPYYNKIFKERNLTRASLEKFELTDLSRLPLLSKEMLRKEGTRSLLTVKPESSGRFFSSSGSTGTPTQILYSEAFHQRVMAVYEARVRNWAGVDRFIPRGMIGGRRVIPEGFSKAPYGRFNFFEKQLYLSAYHISRATTTSYLEQIGKYNCQYMMGYAMSNFFLARFFDELKVEAPAMKAVITSSEKLTTEMRQIFQRVYNCKSFDGWSGVENCCSISETELGELLINPDVGILEILDPHGSPVAHGQSGEVVCTGLLNFDQPLIRYRIGDYVSLRENQTTGCGRQMPVVNEIGGRLEDVVIGIDGREMVRFHGIFNDLTSITKAQIVQQSFTRIVVNVETRDGLLMKDRHTIYNRLTSQLGNIQIDFNEMDDIPIGPGGKFKAVISHVKRIES